MHQIVHWIQSLAEGLGGPGLLLAAFLDSSFLTLPEFCDFLIVVLVAQHPALWFYYALMTTAGSLAGSYVLYAIARKGGEAFLRRRFHERHVDRGMAAFRRYGLLAIIVPSMLPPPMPFKLFVLLAGVSGVRPVTFSVALIIGRGMRYGIEALLAVWYGEAVTRFIRQHSAQVALGLLVAVVVGGLIVYVRRRVRTT